MTPHSSLTPYNEGLNPNDPHSAFGSWLEHFELFKIVPPTLASATNALKENKPLVPTDY